MFNVLTDSFKKDIRDQYKKRRVIVWLIAVICLQISFLVLILPSYIYLSTEEKDLLASNVSHTTANNLADNSSGSKTFQNVNNELSVLSSNIGLNTFDSLILRLTSLKSQGIQLKEIIYQNKTATSSTIILNGVAASRGALLSFSKNIEANDTFYNVDLPVSDFAKNKDIDFSISMTAHI